MLAWLETSVPQPATAVTGDPEPEPADPETAADLDALPVDLPKDLSRLAHCLQDLDQLEIPDSLGRRSAQDLKTLIDSLPGSRIPQAVYLQAVLRLVPGPWTSGLVANPEIELDLLPEDRPLVLEDMNSLVIEWTGHEFAGRSTTLLAEILANARKEIALLGRGKALWFVPFTEDESVGRFLRFNEHEGTTWLNQEALENLLNAMVVCGLAGPTVPRPASLLDGRALILDAAENAGYDLAKMVQIIAKK